MKINGGNDGTREVETRLHSMRGDASRAPDLTAGILSRVAEQRPFANSRTLRLRRWGRLAGIGFAVGLALCAGVVAAQWSQIAPGFAKPDDRPIGGMVSSTVAQVRAGTKSIKQVPARIVFMVRTGGEGGLGRTDPDDSVVVRSITSNVIVPMGAALRVTPSMDVTETELNLTERVIARGQRVLSSAERFASSLKLTGANGGGVGEGAETYADRLGRAVTGSPLGDGGPQ